MSDFSDHFSRQAEAYAAYRPDYPDELFAAVVDRCDGRTTAVDVGCGSGQVATKLAPLFERVVAVEPSVAQLTHAKSTPGVSYVAAQAEAMPVADRVADLVTVGQALHWFDLPRFYDEVRRIARPGCVIAVWVYGLMSANDAADRALDDYYYDIVAPYWPPERRHIETGYTDLPFPFYETRRESFSMIADWTADRYLGMLRSWSATRRYIDDRGDDPIAEIADRIVESWDDPAIPRPVIWPVTLMTGKVI
jgi:SAM-dependent methyltransferase